VHEAHRAPFMRGLTCDPHLALLFDPLLFNTQDKDTGVLVTGGRDIAVHYLRTMFAADMLFVVPFNWFILSTPNSFDTRTSLGLSCLSLLRLVSHHLFRAAVQENRGSRPRVMSAQPQLSASTLCHLGADLPVLPVLPTCTAPSPPDRAGCTASSRSLRSWSTRWSRHSWRSCSCATSWSVV
jgi:hypothetical protein